MAHKKSGGSTSNGRDSNPKMRGVKKYGGETVQTGNIIVRQKKKSSPPEVVLGNSIFTCVPSSLMVKRKE